MNPWRAHGLRGENKGVMRRLCLSLILVPSVLSCVEGLQRPDNQAPTSEILTPSIDTSVQVGEPVQFAGRGTDADGAVADRVWRFGNGDSTRAGDEVTYTFIEPGDWTVSYQVFDGEGLGSVPDSVGITVPTPNAPPTAAILTPSRDTTVRAGDQVAFLGAGSDPDGSITAHRWTFGDVGDGTGADPGPQTFVIGIHWVRYTVEDDAGAVSDADSVRITALEPDANQPPVATIDAPSEDTTATLGDAVTFLASAGDPDGSIAAHAWDFGDGATAAVVNPPPHTYAATGSYWATYRVTDDDGDESVPDSVRVTVVTAPNEVPAATITSPSQDTIATVGDPVTFTGDASDPDGSVVEHAWDFGDGNTASLQNPPAHVYMAMGSYWVTYRVTDDAGAESRPDSVRVTVEPVPNQPPVATIVAPGSDTVVTLGDGVSFRGAATDPDGTVTAHQWSFGDGNGASVEDPGAHTYAAVGIYRATYRVTDDDGAVSVPDTVSVTVQEEGAGGNYALRFFGNGVNDIDRVKILIDDADGSAATPGPPVDVGATDFTIEFWMRAFANENNAPPNFCGSWTTGNMILDRDRFGLDRKFGLSMAGGIITFGLAGDGTSDEEVCGTTRVDDGVWHHVAVTRVRATGAIAVFIDGVREGFLPDGPGGDVSFPDEADCEFDPCPNSNHFLVLGAEKHDVGPEAPSFSGWLDELRISTTIRYTGDFAPPNRRFVADAQTVGLYHFDEGTGTIVHDQSGAPDGPSDGFLSVGGNPTGPIWVVSDAPTGS